LNEKLGEFFSFPQSKLHGQPRYGITAFIFSTDEIVDDERLPKTIKQEVDHPPVAETGVYSMEEGYSNGGHHAQIIQSLLRNGGSADTISRATSPGLGFSTNGSDLEKEKRYRPRTYPYFKHLPYKVEEEAERNAALEEILKQLYIAIKAEDIAPGAVHWTRELKGWLNLKFEITRALRAKLVKLYYMLCLAPGIDSSAADRFESMFRTLTK
jgi:proteasome activator subunit 4